MRTKSLKINAVLSVMKVMLSVIFPLITFPYISRVLRVDALGKINYSNSIVSYFSLFAALGTSTYATREGAKIRNNKDKFTTFSREVFTTNVFTTIISYFILFLCLISVNKFRDYRFIITLYSLSILFSTIGVEWVNTIYEDYTYILLRSFFVQIISLILMFVLVREEQDYIKYVAILVGSQGLISLLNIVHIRKYADIRLTRTPNFARHIRPMIVFFANNLAVTIYLSSDSTMIGWMIGDYYSGLYAVAVRVYSMSKTIINTFYTVAIPRLTQMYAEGEHLKYRLTLTRIGSYLLIIAFPLAIQLFIQADGVVAILAGEDYTSSVMTIRILSISLIFAVLSGLLVTCVNVSRNREIVGLKATAIGAATNVLLNLFMIPMLAHNGAAITTLVAEMLVAVYCIIKDEKLKEYIDTKEIFEKNIGVAVALIVMVVVSIMARRLFNSLIVSCTISGTFGLIIYFVMLYILRNKFALELMRDLKNRVLARKKM